MILLHWNQLFSVIALIRLPLRSFRQLSIGLASAVLGVGCAWWLHHRSTLPKQAKAPPEVVIPMEPPPSREELVQLDMDQAETVVRADGSTVRVGYARAVVDPRWTTVEFFGGWNRELQANEDAEALLFSSGPTFARAYGNGDLGMRLHGDLLMANGLWPSGNRAAAVGRAWIGITTEGELEFGYGALTPDLQKRLRVFIGGLHAFTNTLTTAPESYTGVYGVMNLADVRIIYGLRGDGQLEVVETDDGVLFSDLRLFVEQKGFLAAYLPDHASKSRLIVPGQRLWSEEQAVWVSGGKPSITQMPFLLKVVPTQEWHEHQLTDASIPLRRN